MSPDSRKLIEAFLAGGPWAVIGASRDRGKYGNRVLRCYLSLGLEVYPVNPGESEIEGQTAYPDLASLPCRVRAISVITPPAVTGTIVADAAAAGVEMIWMQPGAESDAAVADARRRGLEVIAGGPCFLVESGC